MIVGTRGETPEYFEQAYQFIDGLDVTQLHVFSYSERPGTQALKIEYVVSPEEKHQRSQRLLALSDQKTQAFYARHIGQTMPVLMEKSKAGAPMHGFTENYIRVEVESDDSLDNQVINVRLGEFNEEMTALKGTIFDISMRSKLIYWLVYSGMWLFFSSSVPGFYICFRILIIC